MIPLALIWLSGVVATMSVAAPGDEAEAAEAPAPAIALLDKLEARGRELDAYQADVVYTREQGLLGDRQVRIGQVLYQAGSEEPDRPARFAIRFTHLIADGARRERPRHFIFDGTWLAEVHPDQKQFIKRQVVAGGERFDPLKIGEGPFPLPLGQRRADITRLFEPRIVAPADDDPADTTHLKLVAKKHPDTGKPATQFEQVDLWYDHQTLLPVKVITLEGEDEAEANVTTVRLRDATTPELTDEQAAEAFSTKTPPRGQGWFVQIKPLELDKPKPKPNRTD